MWYTVPKVFVVSLDVKLIYCDLACDNTQSYYFFSNSKCDENAYYKVHQNR